MTAYRPASLARCLVGILLSLTVGVRAAAGQELRGVVLDSTSRRPIAGAVVVLLDSTRAAIGRTLSSASGEYRVTLSPAIRRLQVLRIGFRPRTIDITESQSGVTRLDIVMVAIATLLEPVRITENPRCSRRSDAAAAFALWEQTRAALLATVAARDLTPSRMVRLRFHRVMDETSDRIVSQQVRLDSSNVPSPFYAERSVADFVRDGFASDSAGSRRYHGPDADILLDPSFVLSYCFRVVNAGRERPNQIGLGFAAADRRRGRIDIDGVLWIDTVARALHDIDFRYVGLPSRIEAEHPGGQVSFRELPNGIVFIDRWLIRAISTRVDTTVTNRGPTPRLWFEARETGGEVATAQWADGTRFEEPLGKLRVHAITATGSVVPGTVVALSNTDYRGIADDRGLVAIDYLIPGPYVATVLDSTLATVELTLPTSLAFTAHRDSVFGATFRVPTAEEYVADACIAVNQPVSRTPESAWLLARARSLSGKSLNDLSIEVRAKNSRHEWMTVGSRDRATNGIYALCDLELHSEIQIVVRRRGFEPRIVDRQLATKLTVIPIEWP